MVATATPKRLYAGAPDQAVTVPTVRQATAGQGGSGSNVIVSMPVAVAGDLIQIGIYLAGSGGGLTDTAMTGYTKLSFSDPAFTSSFFLYYKVADGSEPSSYTLSQTASMQWGAIAVSVQNVDTLNLAKPQVSIAGYGNNSLMTLPALPVNNFGLGFLWAYTNDTAAPAGWTQVATCTPGWYFTLWRTNVTASPIAAVSKAGWFMQENILAGKPNPTTARYTSDAVNVTTITEIEMVNDDIVDHVFRVKSGAAVLVPGLLVPANSVGQYQLKMPMGATENLTAAASGPNTLVNVAGVVTT